MLDNPNKLLEEIESLCHKVFIQSKDGKRLHDLLIELYIVHTPVMMFTSGAYNAQAAHREGQNDMIRQLKGHALHHENKVIAEKTRGEVTNDPSTATNSDTTTEPFHRPAAVRFDV